MIVHVGGEDKTFRSRAAARMFFENGMRCCEGSERDRYMIIVMQIDDGVVNPSDENPDYMF